MPQTREEGRYLVAVWIEQEQQVGHRATTNAQHQAEARAEFGAAEGVADGRGGGKEHVFHR
jgi:hypothetical protein